MGFNCCGLFIDGPVSFDEHNQLAHFPSSRFVNSNFKCPICRSSISRLDNYKRHLINKHCQSVANIFGSISSVSADSLPAATLPGSQFALSEFQVEAGPSESDSFFFDQDVEMQSASESEDDGFIQAEEIPVLQKAEEELTIEFDSIILFCRLLTSLKYSLNVAQKHINDKNSPSLKLSKHKNHDFYYTDLSEILSNYLCQPEICGQLLQEKRRAKSRSHMKNINDLERHQSDDFTIKLLLNLYWDDYDAKHFSKSKSVNTNMSVVYCCIGNIDYQYQSKRSQISLLGIGKTSEIKTACSTKKESLDAFFGPIKQQLREAKSNPIEIKNKNGDVFKVDVEVCAFSADNLGMNKVLGLPESFAQTQCCQYCTIWFRHFDSQILPRVPEELDHIFEDMPFTGPIFVPDLFHDLHEGIVLDLMNYILSLHTESEFKRLKKDFESFKGRNQIDLPGFYYDNSLKGTGVEIMNFFLYFPFYNSKFSTSNELYEQYLKLRKIVNFLMSHTVNENQLEQFDRDVEQYIEASKRNGLSFTLKLHHLQHYRKLIMDFGPLANFSTLRFERYHQIARAYCRASVSTSELPETGLLISKDNIRSEISEEFLSFIDFDDDLLLLECTTISRSKIEAGGFYLVSETDRSVQGYPVFFYVEHIKKQGDQVEILGYHVSTDAFDREMYSYLVQFSGGPTKLASNLKHYKKLDLLELETGEQYISKTFHLLSQTNYSI